MTKSYKNQHKNVTKCSQCKAFGSECEQCAVRREATIPSLDKKDGDDLINYPPIKKGIITRQAFEDFLAQASVS